MTHPSPQRKASWECSILCSIPSPFSLNPQLLSYDFLQNKRTSYFLPNIINCYILLYFRDEAHAIYSTLFFFLIWSKCCCFFISYEFKNSLIKFLLEAVQATNKTILQRRYLKGEGEAFLGQCEGKESQVSIFNLYSQPYIVFLHSHSCACNVWVATPPSAASKFYVSWRTHTYNKGKAFSLLSL